MPVDIVFQPKEIIVLPKNHPPPTGSADIRVSTLERSIPHFIAISHRDSKLFGGARGYSSTASELNQIESCADRRPLVEPGGAMLRNTTMAARSGTALSSAAGIFDKVKSTQFFHYMTRGIDRHSAHSGNLRYGPCPVD